MTNLSLSEFHGLSVNIIDHDGRKWLTAEEAGRCLGYTQEHARTSINKLLARHFDEFTEADSTEVKMAAADGKLRTMRIFSEAGCHSLGFFANTPRSKEFRVFTKKVLASRSADQAAYAEMAARLRQAEHELLAAQPQWGQLMRFRAMGLEGRQIALLLGVSHSAQEKMVRKLRASALGHLLPAAARPPVGRKMAVADSAQILLEL